MINFLRRRNLWRPALPFLWLIGICLFLVFKQYSLDRTQPNAEVLPASFADIQSFDDALDLQNAFIRNAKAIGPSVVSVNRVEEVTQKSSSNLSGADNWFLGAQSWLRNVLAEKHYMVENVGSGIIFNDDGYILTNYHVVDGLDRILLKLSDGREYFGRVVGGDPLTDLTVLKISTLKKLRQPKFGRAETMKVGEWVMAIGNPYGLEGTVTVGVVSGKGRSDLGIATFENFIQTDASINPGNSGGPLINLKGEIVGINTAVAAIGSGVGFAIPIEMARKIGDELILRGQIERGWLGVSIQSVTPELAATFHAEEWAGGVLVNRVEPATPAQKAGFLRGDIIIQFNGKTVLGSKKFQIMVANTKIGEMVPVTVIRDGEKKTIRVKIGKYVS